MSVVLGILYFSLLSLSSADDVDVAVPLSDIITLMKGNKLSDQKVSERSPGTLPSKATSGAWERFKDTGLRTLKEALSQDAVKLSANQIGAFRLCKGEKDCSHISSNHGLLREQYAAIGRKFGRLNRLLRRRLRKDDPLVLTAKFTLTEVEQKKVGKRFLKMVNNGHVTTFGSPKKYYGEIAISLK